jgi:hypothetical protein
MSCASCSAVEIRVPARNVSDQGLTTFPCAFGVSKRMIGFSSRDGVPGGISSYATSEKTTTPTGASESTSD